MSRQNPFMRSSGDRHCSNCQNGCQNNCNDQQSCCYDIGAFIIQKVTALLFPSFRHMLTFFHTRAII